MLAALNRIAAIPSPPSFTSATAAARNLKLVPRQYRTGGRAVSATSTPGKRLAAEKGAELRFCACACGTAALPTLNERILFAIDERTAW